MQKNMTRELRTVGYVARRTNYMEADRILDLITPEGKIGVIAKGVRRSRSKLAGGIELFTLSDYNLHIGKGKLGTVTGVKMVKHYGEILKDYQRLELGGVMLKKISRAAEGVDSAEYFEILSQGFVGLNTGIKLEIVDTWFNLRLKKAMGEEVNLYRDADGVILSPVKRYDFDGVSGAFIGRDNGEYGADEIKLLRLMITTNLDLVRRVKADDEIWSKVTKFAQMIK